MSNYADLKAAIAAVVKTNGNNEITGAIMQSALLSIINAISQGSIYAGVATPTTAPGTPDGNLFYIAAQPGNYANFGGYVLTDKVTMFSNITGEWVATVLPLPNGTINSGFDIPLISGGGYLTATGTVMAQTQYDVSDFVAVNPGDILYYTGTTGASTYGMIGYNSGQSFVSVLVPNAQTFDNYKVVIPEGVYFVKVSGRNTTYPGTTVGVSVKLSINPTSLRDWVNSIIDTVLALLQTDVVFSPTGYLNAAGGITATNTYSNTYYIPVQPGNFFIYNGQTGTSTYGAFGYSDRAGNNPVVLLGVSQNVRDYHIVVPDGINFVRLSGRNESFGAGQYAVNATFYSEIYSQLQDLQNQINELAVLIGEIQLVNIVPVNSRFDANTMITATSAGLFTIGAAVATLSQGGDNSVRVTPVEPQTTSVVLRTTQILNNNAGEKYLVKFSARAITNPGRTLYVALGDSNGNIGTTGGAFGLTSEWVEYSANMIVGTLYPNRIAFMLTPVNSMTYEIKDLVVGKADSLAARVEALEKAERPVTYGLRASFMGDSISSGNNARDFTVMDIDIGGSLQGYPTYYDVGKTIGNVTVTSDMIGTLVTFGDIQAADVGKFIGETSSNAITTNRWWQVLCNLTGMEQLQNVSMSSISVSSHEDTGTLKGFYLWHPSQIKKLSTRDSAGNTVTPDVIVIFRGTNDMTHSPYSKLTDFGDASRSIPATDVLDGGGYGFKEAYCIAIKKIWEAYPKAKIFLCTLNLFKRVNFTEYPTNNGTNTLPEYNAAVREVANFMGCGIIEFSKSGVNWENLLDYAPDNTHPNVAGHALLGRKAAVDLLSQFSKLDE
jgi:lysophospholipase L1-like esterase